MGLGEHRTGHSPLWGFGTHGTGNSHPGSLGSMNITSHTAPHPLQPPLAQGWALGAHTAVSSLTLHALLDSEVSQGCHTPAGSPRPRLCPERGWSWDTAPSPAPTTESSSVPAITHSRTWRGCPEPCTPQARGGHTLLCLCLAGSPRLQPTASLQPRFVTEQEPGGGRIKANLSGSSPLVTLSEIRAAYGSICPFPQRWS